MSLRDFKVTIYPEEASDKITVPVRAGSFKLAASKATSSYKDRVKMLHVLAEKSGNAQYFGISGGGTLTTVGSIKKTPPPADSGEKVVHSITMEHDGESSDLLSRHLVGLDILTHKRSEMRMLSVQFDASSYTTLRFLEPNEMTFSQGVFERFVNIPFEYCVEVVHGFGDSFSKRGYDDYLALIHEEFSGHWSLFAKHIDISTLRMVFRFESLSDATMFKVMVS